MKNLSSVFFALIVIVNAAAQNVGIGTTVPAAMLHVQFGGASGAIPANTAYSIFEHNGINNYINLLSPANSENGFIFGRTGVAANDAGIYYNVGDGTGNGFQFRVGGNNKIMTLASTGNVGIGITDPNYRLHIKGGNGFAIQSDSAGVGITQFNYNNTGDNYYRGFKHNFDQGSWLFTGPGNMGIGTNSPDTSAKLEIRSTTQGFLPPRMTIAQRNAIANPATGLVIFCIDCDELELFNGTVWKAMEGTAACVSSSLPFIKICDQVWMSKNLDVTTYRNGEPIPQVTDDLNWYELTTDAWCWYNNDSATYAAIYGRLYNWYAVNDPRGLAPLGWHIPTSAEYAALSTCLGGNAEAGGPMKEAGTTHWLSPNTGATNTSGFTALPGGNRVLNFAGEFNYIGQYGYWWTSSTFDGLNAFGARLDQSSNDLTIGAATMNKGMSVRCVRD